MSALILIIFDIDHNQGDKNRGIKHRWVAIRLLLHSSNEQVFISGNANLFFSLRTSPHLCIIRQKRSIYAVITYHLHYLWQTEQWWARSGLKLQHFGHLKTNCPLRRPSGMQKSFDALPFGTAPYKSIKIRDYLKFIETCNI